MTIYPSLNATVRASTPSTGFDCVYDQMTIEEAVVALQRIVKGKKFDGIRNKHLAYVAHIAGELANNSVIHKARAIMDELENLVGRYTTIDSTDPSADDKYAAIDIEIANSFFNIEYKASKKIDPSIAEDISAYPDQYNINLTEEGAGVEIRISGKVGWSDQCFPETAFLQFKLLESQNWSTFPATEPENQAVLEYAGFLINHA